MAGLFVLIGGGLVLGLLGGSSYYIGYLRVKGASNFVKRLEQEMISSQLIDPSSKENPFRIPRIRGIYKEGFKISYSVMVSKPTDGQSSAGGNTTYNRQQVVKDRGSFTYIEIEGDKIFGISKLYIASATESNESHVAGAEIIESYEDSPLNDHFALWCTEPLLGHAIFGDETLSAKLHELLGFSLPHFTSIRIP